MEWKCWLKPTPLSDRYQVKMTYRLGGQPRITVLQPNLNLFEGQDKIPHMYSQERLCLFHPKNREWTPHMLLSRTVVPWISDWLGHYEYWLATGVWSGGGIEH